MVCPHIENNLQTVLASASGILVLRVEFKTFGYRCAPLRDLEIEIPNIFFLDLATSTVKSGRFPDLG